MLESHLKMDSNNSLLTEVIQPHIVSVRSLVEFVFQAGDLTSGGFQRRDRAQLGTQGHKRVQRSRPKGYDTEVEIAYQVEADLLMEVRGRIDGLYVNNEPVVLEEIKTTTLSLELIDEGHNKLHWAQAQCYAYMYAQQQHLSQISIHLTYYHLDSHQEKTFERHFMLAELKPFSSKLSLPTWIGFGSSCMAIQAGSIHPQLGFSYGEYRPGSTRHGVANLPSHPNQ